MHVGFFFGCTVTVLVRELYESVERVLRMAKVNYTPLGIDQCCGIPLILSGKDEVARNYAEKILKEIAISKIESLVTLCPHCYMAFSKEYPEVFGFHSTFKVIHFTQFLENLITKRKIRFRKNAGLKLAYHDPCYLGRMGPQIYEAPRKILESIPGVRLVELDLNRDDSTCCGGGGSVKATYPLLSLEVAKEKIEREVKPLGVDGLVTSCPFCYLNFKEASPLLKTFTVVQLVAEYGVCNNE